MAASYTSWHTVAVIVLCCLSSLRAMYLIHTTEYMENNQCMMRLAIKGHGVDDVLYTNCEAGRNMKIRVENNYLLVGDSTDSLSAFTFGPGCLIVNDNSKDIVERRSYQGGLITGTEFFPRSKIKLFTWNVRNWVSAKFACGGLIYKDVIVIKSEKLSKLQDSCTGSIAVVGNGINYFENTSCTQVQDTRVVFSPVGVILAKYTSVGKQNILLNTSNSAVSINGKGNCSRKELSNKDQSLDNGTDMDAESCREAKTIVDRYLGVRIYRHTYWKDNICMQDMMVRGYGVAKDITEMSCNYAEGVSVEYVPSEGLFLLEDFTLGTRLFTDKPGSLMLVRHGICDKIIYSRQLTEKFESLSLEDCYAVKERMRMVSKTLSQMKTAVKFLEFKILRKNPITTGVKNDDGTDVEEQEIEITGKGIRSMVTGPVSVLNTLELHTTPLGLILCDYKQQQICVVAEIKSTVNVGDTKCSKVTFDGGSGDHKEREADQETCDAAKQKLILYRTLNV